MKNIRDLIEQIKNEVESLRQKEGFIDDRTYCINNNQSVLGLLQNADLINQQGLPLHKTPPDLVDDLIAVKSQSDYTNMIFKTLSRLPKSNENDLISVKNLISSYLQETDSLNKILQNLSNKLESSFPMIDRIRERIKEISTHREELKNLLTDIELGFGRTIDELELKNLLDESVTILNNLKGPHLPLSDATNAFIQHLEVAQGLLKSFRRKGEAIDDSEVDEIQNLIDNWGKIIDQLEEKNRLNNSSQNQEAVTQSIEIHDLLEKNYDFLTTLIRSGDLESSGIL